MRCISDLGGGLLLHFTIKIQYDAYNSSSPWRIRFAQIRIFLSDIVVPGALISHATGVRPL